MIGLDTNVVVRALTQDEPVQAEKAAALLSADAVSLTKTVLLEVEWVLRGAYGFDQEAINAGLRRLVGLENLVVEDRPAVLRALAWRAAGMDFADALHLASSSAVESFATFDREFARTASQIGAHPPVNAL